MSETIIECDPIWDYFGLSYSAYLVLPRVALCSMPLEWQKKFVTLMEEAEKLLPDEAQNGEYWVRKKIGNKFVTDPFTNYRHHLKLELKETVKERKVGE
jgi:hypothetical protein